MFDCVPTENLAANFIPIERGYMGIEFLETVRLNSPGRIAE